MKIFPWYASIVARLGHVEDYYKVADDHSSDGLSHSLYPKNIMKTQPLPMDVGPEKVADLGTMEERNRVPWL